MSLLPPLPNYPVALPRPRQRVKESQEKVEESERREKEEPQFPHVPGVSNLLWWLAVGMMGI